MQSRTRFPGLRRFSLDAVFGVSRTPGPVRPGQRVGLLWRRHDHRHPRPSLARHRRRRADRLGASRTPWRRGCRAQQRRRRGHPHPAARRTPARGRRLRTAAAHRRGRQHLRRGHLLPTAGPRRPAPTHASTSKPSPTRKGSPSSAGGNCPRTRREPRSVRRHSAACRTWSSCSSPHLITSAVSISIAASIRSASARNATACTSRRCPVAPWCTRACSPQCNCRNTFRICATSVVAARSRSCTVASRRTRSRPGRWPIPSASSPTTARSTPCAETATGCTPARPCSPAPRSPATCPGSHRSAHRRRPIRRRSTKCSNSCISAAAACRTRC